MIASRFLSRLLGRLRDTVMAAKLRSSRATRALRLALQLTEKPSR